MTKTVIIPDDVHILIVKKQIYLRENYGVNPRITDMVVAYIRAGLDRTEELLNINTGKPKIEDMRTINRGPKIELVGEDEVVH